MTPNSGTDLTVKIFTRTNVMLEIRKTPRILVQHIMATLEKARASIYILEEKPSLDFDTSCVTW